MNNIPNIKDTTPSIIKSASTWSTHNKFVFLSTPNTVALIFNHEAVIYWIGLDLICIRLFQQTSDRSCMKIQNRNSLPAYAVKLDRWKCLYLTVSYTVAPMWVNDFILIHTQTFFSMILFLSPFFFVLFLFFQVIVLIIGTNNHGDTANQVADGILAIVKAIQERQPSSHVIVMVIVPFLLLPDL